MTEPNVPFINGRGGAITNTSIAATQRQRRQVRPQNLCTITGEPYRRPVLRLLDHQRDPGTPRKANASTERPPLAQLAALVIELPQPAHLGRQ